MNTISGASHVGELLEQLRGEGEFDSLGQFTLSMEKALAKIRGMAEQEPVRWLSFAVQAGVAAYAERISVSLAYDRVCITLHLGPHSRSLDTPHELLAGQAQAAHGDPVEYLRSAILWARAQQPVTLDVLYSSPTGGFLLVLGSDEPARSAQPPSAQMSLQLAARFADRSQQRVAVYSRELASRLSFCPVPVILEGMVLNTGTATSPEWGGLLAERMLLADASEPALLTLQAPRLVPALKTRVGASRYRRGRSGSPVAVVEHLEIGGALPADAHLVERRDGLHEGDYAIACWTEDEAERQLVIPNYRPVPLDTGDTRVAGRALFLRTRSRQNNLNVIQHGCRLNAVPLVVEWSGWEVFVAANSVQTDLSGSMPIQNEGLEALIGWVRAQIQGVHFRCATHS